MDYGKMQTAAVNAVYGQPMAGNQQDMIAPSIDTVQNLVSFIGQQIAENCERSMGIANHICGPTPINREKSPEPVGLIGQLRLISLAVAAANSELERAQRGLS